MPATLPQPLWYLGGRQGQRLIERLIGRLHATTLIKRTGIETVCRNSSPEARTGRQDLLA
jgi:hypothetical protein